MEFFLFLSKSQDGVFLIFLSRAGLRRAKLARAKLNKIKSQFAQSQEVIWDYKTNGREKY